MLLIYISMPLIKTTLSDVDDINLTFSDAAINGPVFLHPHNEQKQVKH